MVTSEGVHEPKNFWNAMTQQFKGFDSDGESSHDDVRDDTVRKAWDQSYQNKDHLLFGARETNVDLSTLHPGPVHILKLWQIYLDNVNPLLKITHTPSLQGRIIEAAGDVTSIISNLEALMFSIYCMSILSLSEDDCQATFDSPSEDLLTRYQFGCQQALLNSAFLRSSDRDCLTALFMYLVSLRPSTDPRPLSSMLGVAIRIGQRMGIHSEIACAKRNVLEAEMCRRLWWALVLFDTRISEMADHRTATLAPTWDCKVPLNVNDSDLRPEMKESPAAQGSPTEALFAVVRSQLGEFTRNTAFHLDFSNPALKPLAKAGGDLDTLEKHFEDGYLKPLDPENPLHYITIWITRAYFAKSRLVEHFWRHATLSVHQTESQRDAAVSYALRTLECDTTIMTSPLTKGYYWFANNYFPFPAYIQILQDLRRRPMSKHAAQAWEVMSDNYEARFTFSTTRNDSIFLKLVSKVVLQAWEAREKASMQIGEPLMPPRMTSFIAQKVAQTAQQAQSPNTVATTGYMLQNTDGFPMSMPIPMGFGSDNLLSGMGGQDGYAGIGASPPDLDMDQMLWTAMGWDLPQQSSVPAAAPGPWNYG